MPTNSFGELLYTYFNTAVSTKMCLVQINPFKVWFPEKINDHLAVWIFSYSVTKIKNLPELCVDGFFGNIPNAIC